MPFPILALSEEIALEILSNVGLGDNVTQDELERVRANNDTTFSEMEAQMVGNLPNEEIKAKFDDAIKDWHSLVEDKLNQSKNQPSSEKLTLLDNLQDEQNLQLVKDEAVTLHMAGLHTTSALF